MYSIIINRKFLKKSINGYYIDITPYVYALYNTFKLKCKLNYLADCDKLTINWEANW